VRIGAPDLAGGTQGRMQKAWLGGGGEGRGAKRGIPFPAANECRVKWLLVNEITAVHAIAL